MSSIQYILQILASIFEYVKKESDYRILNIKDIREKTYDLTSELKEDISTVQKKVDTLNVGFDNINQYDY